MSHGLFPESIIGASRNEDDFRHYICVHLQAFMAGGECIRLSVFATHIGSSMQRVK